jgi:hypothetical protein
VLGLNGRLTFKGTTAPYPKDCMLSVFGVEPGFDVWSWRNAKPSDASEAFAPAPGSGAESTAYGQSEKR